MRVFGRRRYPDLEAAGVESSRGDLSNFPALRSAARGAAVVFHTAAVSGVAGPWNRYAEPNIHGALNVLSAALSEKVGRFVHTSTPSVVYGRGDIDGGDESLPYPERHLCAYAATKALAERAILRADGPDIRTVALRPHLIWGPGDNHLLPTLLERAEAGRLRRVGGGRNRVSVSYVENVADAHLAACDALGRDPETVGGRAYFINDDDPVNCWDFISDFLNRCGARPPTRGVSAGAAYAAGALQEAWAALRRWKYEPTMTRFLALQLSTTHWFHNEAAKRDLGWTPAAPREEGWKRTLADLKALRRRRAEAWLASREKSRRSPAVSGSGKAR